MTIENTQALVDYIYGRNKIHCDTWEQVCDLVSFLHDIGFTIGFNPSKYRDDPGFRYVSLGDYEHDKIHAGYDASSISPHDSSVIEFSCIYELFGSNLINVSSDDIMTLL